MTLLNQEQLEIRMAEVGYAKTQANIAAAEARGAADQTPYAATVYRDYVQPLADLVQKAQATKGPAANAAHVALPRPMNQPTTRRSRLCTGLTLMASPFLLAPVVHGASARRRIAPS